MSNPSPPALRRTTRFETLHVGVYCIEMSSSLAQTQNNRVAGSNHVQCSVPERCERSSSTAHCKPLRNLSPKVRQRGTSLTGICSAALERHSSTTHHRKSKDHSMQFHTPRCRGVATSHQPPAASRQRVGKKKINLGVPYIPLRSLGTTKNLCYACSGAIIPSSAALSEPELRDALPCACPF